MHSIFNYWFISFEKFSNSTFTESKLGEIPKDWRIGILKDLLSLKKNPIKPSETNGLPYLPIDIIPMNSLGISELKSDEEANSSLISFDKNDILIGAMRVYFHRVVISPCSGITRSTCFVLKPKKEYYLSYLLLLCNLDQTIQYAQNTSKGTTMPYAVWDNGLGDMDIIIPPEDILNEFHNLVFPIIEKIRDNYNEINKLQKLRDTLLPKLMSGEIDVSKINCDLIITSHYLSVRFPVIQHLFIKSYNLTSRLIDTAINI
ncbi:MAG: restriction endonuclease subunit S [Methanobrevibacter sp.]|uniref:restriction endonuclease subunit S n=1 Tax=Methanobrevibacter sp. TaxID=66852 RepID=UPI003F0C8D3A